jgi:pyruvate formate lyase activating enzyme
MSIDPIEKKPLYHFMPGAGILSVGTYGCNLSCKFCQNWEISQREAGHRQLTPEELARLAESTRGQSVGVAYTYSEPLVWYEFVHDCVGLIHERGLVNVLVTNGYINREPFGELLPYIDAVNIDLKAFSSEFYKSVCGGDLEPVLRSIRQAYESGCHVELTTLVVPGLNDSGEEMDSLATWIAALSPDIPLHVSRYFPSYRMTAPPTPMPALQACVEAARTRLHYVYVGNATVPGGSDTVCPSCGTTVIRRHGYDRVEVLLSGSSCPECGAGIPVRLRGRGPA